MTVQTLIEEVILAHQRLQKIQPLVQCITNQVAANYVANILLAAKASPAMIDNPLEVASFAQVAQALSINLGTPQQAQVEAMHLAAHTMQQLNKPWVLDPVGYGSALPWRSEIANQLLSYQPHIIRGNASEIANLAGMQTENKGVDSVLNSNHVYLEAKKLLSVCQCVAISGKADFILSKELNITIQVNGGSFLQPRITATGCALGALIAAYSVVSSATIASLSAHVHFAIAGKLAAQQAVQVGQFNVAFLDYIDQMNADLISQHIDLKII